MKPEQLTAWALDELSPEERAQVEAAVDASPQARDRADEVQLFCALLTEELGGEDLALDQGRRQALLHRVPANVVAFDAGAGAARTDSKRVRAMHRDSKPEREWEAGWLIRAAAMAACALLVGVIIHASMQDHPAVATAGDGQDEVIAASTERVKVSSGQPARSVPKTMPFQPAKADPALVRAPVGPSMPLPSPAPQDAVSMKADKQLTAAVPAPSRVTTPITRQGTMFDALADMRAMPGAAIGLDMDPAAYAAVKRSLQSGVLPPVSVRGADLINAFRYGYEAPTEEPLKITASVVDAPWAAGHRLVRVAVQARADADAVVAQQVKLDVQFNAEVVRSARVLGYEGSASGATTGVEVASGRSITALVEIVPVSAQPSQDQLLGDATSYPSKASNELPRLTGVPPLKKLERSREELLTVRLSYQSPGSPLVKSMELPVIDAKASINSADADLKFAAAVAGFSMLLRHTEPSTSFTWDQVRALAAQGQGVDPTGERKEFLRWIDAARALTGKP